MAISYKSVYSQFLTGSLEFKRIPSKRENRRRARTRNKETKRLQIKFVKVQSGQTFRAPISIRLDLCPVLHSKTVPRVRYCSKIQFQNQIILLPNQVFGSFDCFIFSLNFNSFYWERAVKKERAESALRC